LLDLAIFYYNEAVQRYEQAIMPLVYQLNNRNSCWVVKPRYVGCGSKSSWERKFHITFAPSSIIQGWDVWLVLLMCLNHT